MTTKPTIIITGASRGLGAAAAEISAAMGANVILTARSLEGLQAVAGRIRAAGGVALALQGDISEMVHCHRVVHQAVEQFGRIDGVVNNAGVIAPIARIADVDPAAWDTLMRINVTGPLMLTQAALPYLREAKGRVINISSGAAENPRTGWGAYCVSKAGLNMFTQMLATEEPDVIAVAVRPGVVDTAMQDTIREAGAAGMTGEDHTRFIGLYTDGDLLPPESPGRAVAVLAQHAPPSFSGAFVHWSDDHVQSLVKRYAPGG